MASARQFWKKPLLVWRLTRREMRGGLSGFRIFLLCLILGIAAIAGVGSLSSALVAGLTSEGQAILGGDISLRLGGRQANAAERAWLDARADVSEIATLRSMAHAHHDSAPVEVKAIDNAYPLYGALAVSGAEGAEAGGAASDKGEVSDKDVLFLPPRDNIYHGIAESGLFDRLNLALGDVITLGTIKVRLVAKLLHEPDRTSGGFPLAPRLLLAQTALDNAGLVQPGSLVNYHYRVKLPAISTGAPAIAAFRSSVGAAFPLAGWRIRDSSDASPSLRRFIERLALFFTAIGLTALVVGGVGVSNAIRAYLAARRESMAILKSLGASAGMIVAIYGMQIAAFSVLGIVVGLALGASAPWLTVFIVHDIIGSTLPIKIITALYPAPLLAAAGFGVLTAAAFALYPLGAIEHTPVAQLFGGTLRMAGLAPPRRYRLAVLACFGGLVAMAVLVSESYMVALWFCLGLALAYFALRATAFGVVRAAHFWLRLMRARKLPILHRKSNMIVRMALTNITRPHAPILAVSLSIGLSVALLASVALVQGNITRQISGDLPTRTPSFFMLDIQPHQITAVRALVAQSPHIRDIETSAMLRGQILSINGIATSALAPPAEAAWILRGDRNLTYAATPPPGGEIVAGTWWAENYDGAPLVSFDANLAAHLGLAIGDTLEVNILGRPLQARIANFRHIDWASGGINFAMIFSPAPLRDAPHIYLASVQMDTTLDRQATSEAEYQFVRTMAQHFPTITIIRVKEALDTATALLQTLNLAVQAISALTLITGLLVLAGAMAGTHHARIYDSVIMKVLGASRGHILAVFALEYMLIGSAAAMIAAGLATLAAWGLVSGAMDSAWVFLPLPLLGTLMAGVVVAACLGLITTALALRAPPAQALRL